MLCCVSLIVVDPRQPVREVERCRPAAQERAEISALGHLCGTRACRTNSPIVVAMSSRNA